MLMVLKRNALNERRLNRNNADRSMIV
jgi:hypothetical protein